MKLPPTLVNELLKKNIDEADITQLIITTFNLSDDLKPIIYHELSDVLLERSCELLKKGEKFEAIDKLCKSVELIIRSLGLNKKVREAIDAENQGKWTPSITERVAEKVGLYSLLQSVYSFFDTPPSLDKIKNTITQVKDIIKRSKY